MKQKTATLLVVILYYLLIPPNLTAQTNLGVSFHQSRDTKIGVFVDIERWAMAEVRIVDFVQIKEFSSELLGFFKLTARETSEVYIGGGYGLSQIVERSGGILAVGANVYPFKTNKFGIHFELNPIFPEIDDPIMRVSWGLRFRFGKEEGEN